MLQSDGHLSNFLNQLAFLFPQFILYLCKWFSTLNQRKIIVEGVLLVRDKLPFNYTALKLNYNF